MGGGRWAVVSSQWAWPRARAVPKCWAEGQKALEMKLPNPHTTKQQTPREKIIRELKHISKIYNNLLNFKLKSIFEN